MQQTMELRNSLMSASSVKEARDATLLADNVKSLTYVNIIYLPLSYCASLWGMESDSSTSKLIWVTVIVCLVTCLAVTNLEVAVRSFRKAWKKIFSLARQPLVARMSRQGDETWRNHAQELDRSTGADEKTDAKPTQAPNSGENSISKHQANGKQQSAAKETPKSRYLTTLVNKLRYHSTKDIEKGNAPIDKIVFSIEGKDVMRDLS
ncbi:hypothetical protein B0T20DRAFT_457237 [Sordaria brevicollis]|uniref:Uncharacterized protein n=1 Tax=Sordaria brevicollis TaxID=83679 RepID=A0AAE0U2I6_SORBR|nr:hypothetical protein B0T20DRAFT_457237 [Sordaria brevicollis]